MSGRFELMDEPSSSRFELVNDAGASGPLPANAGLARFASSVVGLPVDTVENALNLGKAAIGAPLVAMGRPDLAPTPSSGSVGGSEWIRSKLRATGIPGLNPDNPTPNSPMGTAQYDLTARGGFIPGGVLPALGSMAAEKIGGPQWAGVGALIPSAASMAFNAGKSAIQGTPKPIANIAARTDGAIVDALKETGQSVEDLPSAQLSSLRKQVSYALSQGQTPDVAALLRKQDFDALGIPSTLGQITRDPTQFARERNLRGVAGVGDPLMQRLDVQNQALQQRISNLSRGASESVTAGENISGALKDVDEALRRNVTKEYQAARESAGKDLNVPIQGLSQDASQIVEDFGDKIPSAIKNKLDSYGILSGKNQTKIFTFDEADKLLRSINDHVGADRATNTALGRLREAVKTAMLDSGDNDVFSGARNLAASRFKLQDAVPALKAASEGDVAPDAFVRKFIINGNANEVQGMASVLQKTNPQAFQEARAQLGAQIQRAAFGENVAGDKLLAPERLAKAIREIGTAKLSAFFKPEEIDALKRVSRVGAYINSTPSAAAVNTSNTAGTALNLAGNVIPGIPAKVNAAKAIIQPIINQRNVAAAVNPVVPGMPSPLGGPALSQNNNAQLMMQLGILSQPQLQR